MQVNDLQIVNGGQTARTVQQIAEEIGPEIEEAEVLVRIYELLQILKEMDIALNRLDHRNFEQARKLVEQKSDSYLSLAEKRIGEALGPLFSQRERTLQRLSATFRRADLVDMLLDAGDA